MRILMVTSEAVPFAKTGGLADVAGALPAALQQLGHEVAVVLPLYRGSHLPASQVCYSAAWSVPLGADNLPVSVFGLLSGGVRHYLVSFPPFYDREELYGPPGGAYPDNARRYLLLCRTALELAAAAFRPDVIHCHDWQAAMVPVLLRFGDGGGLGAMGLSRPPVLLTIHNLAYQGIFPPSALAEAGLPPSLLSIDKLEFYGNASFLKGGLVFAGALSTVSPTYAKEIQTPEHGHGLDGVLRLRSSELCGILNGVDYSHWNPETDPLIAANYSAADLSGKRACKKDMLQAFGLPSDALAAPVAGVVSRLVYQKGLDLIAAALPDLMRLGLKLVVLGTGDPQIVARLRESGKRYPRRVAVVNAYDNALAHKVEAGADLFLMPSRYEPCGLNQMYSLRYGTAPVVRATGGLEDTVQQFNPETGEGTGFKFGPAMPEALTKAVREALRAYRHPPTWERLVRAAMAQDFSWRVSAQQYAALYERMLEARSAAGEAARGVVGPPSPGA